MAANPRKAGRKPKARAGSALPPSTEEKLLLAAEKLFTQRGFRNVSVREIAAEAGVNSALVGYHFGGKDRLFAEVFRLHSERINGERRKLLKEITANGRTPDLRELMAAYVGPVFEGANERNGLAVFLQLSSVLAAERMDLYESIATEVFSSINSLFVDHIRQCLPDIPRKVLIWRLFAVIGAILFVNIRPFPPAMEKMLAANPRPSEGRTILHEILPFFVAGMAAPRG